MTIETLQLPSNCATEAAARTAGAADAAVSGIANKARRAKSSLRLEHGRSILAFKRPTDGTSCRLARYCDGRDNNRTRGRYRHLIHCAFRSHDIEADGTGAQYRDLDDATL